MIGHLAGTVSAVRPGYAIISAGSVGYKVFATRELLLTLKQDAEASVWTHLAVRESILDLYGFSNEEELRLFELLLTVSGIGPKSAIGLLEKFSQDKLFSVINNNRADLLAQVGGMGQKRSERLILELKNTKIYGLNLSKNI